MLVLDRFLMVVNLLSIGARSSCQTRVSSFPSRPTSNICLASRMSHLAWRMITLTFRHHLSTLFSFLLSCFRGVLVFILSLFFLPSLLFPFSLLNVLSFLLVVVFSPSDIDQSKCSQYPPIPPSALLSMAVFAARPQVACWSSTACCHEYTLMLSSHTFVPFLVLVAWLIVSAFSFVMLLLLCSLCRLEPFVPCGDLQESLLGFSWRVIIIRSLSSSKLPSFQPLQLPPRVLSLDLKGKMSALNQITSNCSSWFASSLLRDHELFYFTSVFRFSLIRGNLKLSFNVFFPRSFFLTDFPVLFVRCVQLSLGPPIPPAAFGSGSYLPFRGHLFASFSSSPADMFLLGVSQSFCYFPAHRFATLLLVTTSWPLLLMGVVASLWLHK